MMTTLDTYLRQNRIKGRDFAALTEIPEYDISKFRNGRKQPTLDQAFAIEDASGGAVPARDWLPGAAAQVKEVVAEEADAGEARAA